jgi:hypothetical protein
MDEREWLRESTEKATWCLGALVPWWAFVERKKDLSLFFSIFPLPFFVFGNSLVPRHSSHIFFYIKNRIKLEI